MHTPTAQSALLQERYGIPGHIAFSSLYGGTVAILNHEGDCAVVSLQGAQVLSYETASAGEILWLSPQARLGTGKAVRGGIPVCWPWFGPHPDGGDRPAHGFVRTRPWQVVSAQAGADAARLTLAIRDADAVHPAWAHAASLELEVVLDGALTLSLTTRNLGASIFTMTQALHSYLAVDDIAATTVEGLQNVPFIDQLDDGVIKAERGVIRIDREVDRIYQDVRDAITIRDGRRRLRIIPRGSASAVVWNPWTEKSARLGDMGEDGYRRMICIETANAGADAISVTPGASHTLSAMITAATP